MAPHSIVRSPRRRARSDRDDERGAMDVMMSGRGGSAAVAGVVLGVDTHLASCTWGCSFGPVGQTPGRVDGADETAKGYQSLVSWAESFGPVWCAGVEGTGSYGVGLARHLRTAGIAVMEVERPKRRHLRRNGKSDPLDAQTAARAVLAGQTAGQPKSTDGRAEMIRALRAVRHSAVKARSQAANQLQALLSYGTGDVTESLARAFGQGARRCRRSLSPWV